MDYLFELAKIEKHQLDGFLKSLSSVKVDIKSDILEKVASIQSLLCEQLDHQIDSNDDEQDVVRPISRTSNIVRAREEILYVYLLLISKFKRKLNMLSDELEGRHLKVEDAVCNNDFEEVFNNLYALQKKANASKSTDQDHLDSYSRGIQLYLADMLTLLSTLNDQYQSTDLWTKDQFENYLSEVDLNCMDEMIDLVEKLNESQYNNFCKQYDQIKDLPYADLIRISLAATSKDIMNFFRNAYQEQSKNIHELLLGLTEAADQYRRLELASTLNVPFLCISNIHGHQKEDFQSTPMQKIKVLMKTFKKYVLSAQRYYFGEHNMFPDTEMAELTDFSRVNCLRFIEKYKQVQEERLDALSDMLTYSSVSDGFSLDMQNAIFLSEALSPWQRVPVPSPVGVASNPSSLWAPLDELSDELEATSIHTPAGPMNS